MLRDEHGVTAKGRLLPVVARRCRGESPSDQLFCFDENSLQATRCEIVSLRSAEVEPPTKGRIRESSEKLVE